MLTWIHLSVEKISFEDFSCKNPGGGVSYRMAVVRSTLSKIENGGSLVYDPSTIIHLRSFFNSDCRSDQLFLLICSVFSDAHQLELPPVLGSPLHHLIQRQPATISNSELSSKV